MKRRILFVLVAALCLSLFAGCQTQNEVEVTETTTLPPVDPIYNFEVGFSVQMPEGFEEKESQHNDFFGTGKDGYYAVIANTETKEGYADLMEYAQGIADANEAGEVEQDVAGYYYISYINKSDNNQMYTVFAEGEAAFYRITFYCPQSNWDAYESLFPVWAATVIVK